MKGLKRMLTLGMIFLLGLVLVACGGNDDAADEKDTASADVLRVGSTPTGPPYTFMNSETDEMEGIMIDIVKEVANRIGKEIDVQPMTFSSLIPALEGDKIDLISAGMVTSDERREIIDFTDEVFGFGEGLIVHEDTEDIKTFDDLKGKVIGTQKGTVYHDLMEEAGIAGEVTVYETIGDMLKELSNGRLDAVVADEPVLIYLKENNPNFAVKIISDYEPQIIDGVSLGVAKGNDELKEELNKGIQEIIEDGTIEEIYSKWNVDWDLK